MNIMANLTCSICGENPAAFTMTNLETGDTEYPCGSCFPEFILSIAQAIAGTASDETAPETPATEGGEPEGEPTTEGGEDTQPDQGESTERPLDAPETSADPSPVPAPTEDPSDGPGPTSAESSGPGTADDPPDEGADSEGSPVAQAS